MSSGYSNDSSRRGTDLKSSQLLELLALPVIEVSGTGQILFVNDKAVYFLKQLKNAREVRANAGSESPDEKSAAVSFIGDNVENIFLGDWGRNFRSTAREALLSGEKKTFVSEIAGVKGFMSAESTVVPVIRRGTAEDSFMVLISPLSGDDHARDTTRHITPDTFSDNYFLEKRSETILAATKTNLDVIDRDFNVRYVDESWRKIYGDPEGKKCYSYFMDRDEPCEGCGLKKVIETRTPAVTEQALVKENGRIVQVTTIPFQDEKGEWMQAEVNVDITERKKMEEDFKRINIFLDSIIENIPNMVFLKDAKELRFVLFNRAGEELLGYSRQELLGKNDYDFFPKEQADFFVQKDRETMQGEGSIDVQEEYIDTKHKGRRILHTKKAPIRNENGEPEYLMGISEDITDRKEAEDALRDSEERFRTLVANVPGAVFRCLCDEDWTMCFVSRGIQDLTGYPGEDIVNNRRVSFKDIIHPEDREMVSEHINSCISGRKPYQIDYRLITLSGETVWVRENGRGVFGEGDSPVFIDGVIVDITAHVKAEEEIHRQWAILTNLMNNIPFFVFWKDRESLYRGCNKQFAEVSGVGSPENVVGKSDHDLAWKKEEAEHYRRTDMEVVQKGEAALDTEETQQQADGKEAVILKSKVPLRDSNGQVTGVLGIYADITERKEMERQLKLFKDLMSQSSDSLFIVDANTGRILYVNEQASVSLEYSKEELLAKKVSDIETSFSGTEEMEDHFKNLKEKGSIVQRGEHRRKSGGSFPVEVNVKFVELEGDPYIVAVARDITERIKFESALKQSEKRYRTIFENTGTITAIVDGDMGLVMANSEFEKFFGFVPSGGCGTRKIDEFVCQEDIEKVRNYHRLRRIDPDSTPARYELKMIDHAGRERSTYVNVALIPGTEMSVQSFIDLTDLRAKEFELEKQRDLLDSTNKALEHKIKELNEAMGHIKKLEGLVPICSSCKKIMKSGTDPKKTDSWVNIEKYISDRTEASFTHGLCPDCIGKLYGDIVSRKKKK